MQKRVLTMKMVPKDGQALLPNTDFIRLSRNTKTLGTHIDTASITMIRSRSYFVCNRILYFR